MIYNIYSWLFFILNILHVLSKSNITTTPFASLQSSNDKPFITQFLIFSSNSEELIGFQPKHGWILSSDKKFRLYISGFNLQNHSIVFSALQDECTSSDFISPIYHLTSASIIELDVHLKNLSKAHSSIFLCLLPTIETKLNDTLLQNGTQLKGPYFTFLFEKATIPFAAKICLILMLFVFSGFFSGLNLGLMSLSVNDLHLLAESDDPSMRYYAKRVLPLRKRGNFLLCSIVLANVLSNSLGTVLLDSLVHGLFAVMGSTIMIVLLGEIIPQAICSRYGLVIGAHTHVITWASMIVTGIISYPLGFILNKILGQEVTASYTRDQIARMLTKINADIEKPELDVITGVLSIRKKTTSEVMTLLSDVYMLDKDRKTDTELILDLHKHGFSRIPVYSKERSNVIGIVKLRDFALITPEQYHLTVKHVLEFHSHPYGHAKATDSLYNLLQEFLRAHWHIALVQEVRTEEDHTDPAYTTVGIITLEDVFEEILQREIIEEADMFTDNRRKIRRKRAKTMDYTELAKRPVKGPSISPQLKIAVFQFLSTNIQQFTSGFISQEILKILLNYNVYAMIKKQANQSTNSIYLYKKDFRYELFTLIIQGNATLESGVEHIMSTVGSFSFFATSALLAENKTVKDVHRFLDHICTANKHLNNITSLLDEISSIFIADYNLIVNSELHVLQIHRLVWLAAVRATQRQRSNDPHQKRMQPEHLLSNALDEISSVTNVRIDKNNLTNFQRIFHNEKDIIHHVTQTKNENTNINNQSSSFIFENIHSLDRDKHDNLNKQQETNIHENDSLEQQQQSSTAIVCNPLLVNVHSNASNKKIRSNRQNCNNSNRSSSSNEGIANSFMDMNQMFGDTNENTIDDDHGQEEHLIDQGEDKNDLWQQRTTSPTSTLFHTRSDTNIRMNASSSDQNGITNNNNNNPTDRPRRVRSMLNATKCSPS
ncbi:unnamed protein product [Rotaria sordida]|uniref:CNNM transmembrane domain-containing protein n=1 Tax=Rotaria sordida TaxID=392033 RepID=A0A819G9Y3_9BILA|nr:unnamed protein product [Rotaria sordida]CAF3879801.1 unnamed protein product [Rotaria sordida]